MKNLCKSFFISFVLYCCISANQAGAQITITSAVVDTGHVMLYAHSDTATIATLTGLYSDDSYSQVLNIGFNFNFYGNIDSQCVIGENGNLCFNTSLTGGYDQWPISASLLGNTEVLNSVCGPWCDMSSNPFTLTQITTLATGTTPNRIFAVNFCHVPLFNADSMYVTTQIVLHETSNIVEVNITHYQFYEAWIGGAAIVGVQNATGTKATTAPGRDYPSMWNGYNESWRFTPNLADTSYTVASIPFAPISYFGAVYWYDSSTGAYLGYGDSILIPTPTPPVAYVAVGVDCPGSDVFSTDSTEGSIDFRFATSGVALLSDARHVLLYPNPAHDVLSVSADGMISEIEITNLVGQTLIRQSPNAKKVQIDTAPLSPGVYLVKINSAVMRKFVKE